MIKKLSKRLQQLFESKQQQERKRTWRYVCEMNELEMYEAVNELMDKKYSWENIIINGMKRPGEGYKTVRFKYSDFDGLHIQVFDDARILVWSSLMADSFPNGRITLDIPRFNQYLQTINVKFTTELYYDNTTLH